MARRDADREHREAVKAKKEKKDRVSAKEQAEIIKEAIKNLSTDLDSFIRKSRKEGIETEQIIELLKEKRKGVIAEIEEELKEEGASLDVKQFARGAHAEAERLLKDKIRTLKKADKIDEVKERRLFLLSGEYDSKGRLVKEVPIYSIKDLEAHFLQGGQLQEGGLLKVFKQTISDDIQNYKTRGLTTKEIILELTGTKLEGAELQREVRLAHISPELKRQMISAYGERVKIVESSIKEFKRQQRKEKTALKLEASRNKGFIPRIVSGSKKKKQINELVNALFEDQHFRHELERRRGIPAKSLRKFLTDSKNIRKIDSLETFTAVSNTSPATQRKFFKLIELLKQR